MVPERVSGETGILTWAIGLPPPPLATGTLESVQRAVLRQGLVQPGPLV